MKRSLLVAISLLMFFPSFGLSLWQTISLPASEPVGMQSPGANLVYLPVIYREYPQAPGFDYEIGKMINNTSYDWLMDYTYDLIVYYGPRHHDYYQRFTDLNNCTLGGTTYGKNNQLRALNYVESVVAEFGYEIVHEFVPDSNGGYNLIFYKPPSASPSYDSVIEVGAHLDTVYNAPGANDNAAGSAGVMEMARLLKDYPNHHPWKFILFVEEENGIMGSYYHVQNIRNQPFKAALVMDTIGWSEDDPDYMNCIYADSSIPLSVEIAKLFDTIRKTYKINIGWRRCSVSSMYSDQGRYWQYDLPAVLSVGGLPHSNPTLHKCTDNFDRLNKMNAYLTVKQNVGVMLTLDKEP